MGLPQGSRQVPPNPDTIPPPLARRTYGLNGRIDFYDENRKRIVEVKVSDTDGVLPSHEVQTLLYALLYGNGWKPTRAFEIVNLLKGMRYKRVLRRKVKLWNCLRRAFKKLDFDDEMIETLGRAYGPQYWEKRDEEEGSGPEKGLIEESIDIDSKISRDIDCEAVQDLQPRKVKVLQEAS